MKLKTLIPEELIPKSNKIDIEHWEEDEYVITINGKVCGQTLHKNDAIYIKDWLESSLDDIKRLKGNNITAASFNSQYLIIKIDNEEIGQPIYSKVEALKLERWLKTAIGEILNKKQIKEELNQPSPIDGMNKKKAINYIIKTFKVYEKLKGVFSDDAWQPINTLIGEIQSGGIEFNIEKTEYYKDNNGNPAGKIWICEIPFTNQNNKPDKLYVRITAAGAGSINEPLNKYDCTFTIS